MKPPCQGKIAPESDCLQTGGGEERAMIEKTIMDQYPDYTAVIRYKFNGKVRDWAIGAHPTRDNEETLRQHLLRCLPYAEFLDYGIK